MATTDDAPRLRAETFPSAWKMEAVMLLSLCVYVLFRTTLLIERLLHYYNRQEPPTKGLSGAVQANTNLSNVVYYTAFAIRHFHIPA